jgi:hypothetical protein
MPSAPRIGRASVLALCVAAAAVGPGVSVALAAAPEAPVSEPASGIAGTSATLKGELNPHVSATTGYEFTYNTNGTCSEGVTTPPGAEKTGTKLKVSTLASGLEGATEYTFCVVATHQEGEMLESTAGPELKFKTLAAKPVVESESSGGVTPFKATLEATVNPENQPSTACSFEYGKSTKYGASATCEPASLEAGTSGATVTAALAGLEPGSVYHYRILVKNATGETKGADAQLSTLALAAPVLSGGSVSALTSTSATLEALVNPNYQPSTYAFEYATNEALTGATVIEGAAPIEGESAELPVSVEISGLQPGAVYYYRARATNATGASHGEVHSFQALAVPAAVSGEADGPTRTTVMLSGSVNPAGASTTYHFAYVPASEYEPGAVEPYTRGTTTVESASVGSDYAPHPVGPVTVEELAPGTTYHYALVATNTVGTGTGADATFTTAPPTTPVALTGRVEGLSQLSATVTGSADTQGLQTISSFEFGTAPYQGSLVPASVTSASGTVLALAAAFNGDLQPATTYYYRLIATNMDGTSYGAEQSFTTGSFPAPFAVPTSPAFLPFSSIAQLQAKEAAEAPRSHLRPLSNAQKLARALRACRTRPRNQRPHCERQARKRYPLHKKKR